jgi:hypothetical protein
MSWRFFHSNSLRGVANYASERRKRVIPSAGEGPHLLSWIINLYLSIQHRAREVPQLLGGPGDRAMRGTGRNRSLFLLEYFHRVPLFVGRGLFIFERAL